MKNCRFTVFAAMAVVVLLSILSVNYVYSLNNNDSVVYLSNQISQGSFLIRYNANGGSGSPSSQIKTYGSNILLATSIPVKEGYVFEGWECVIDGEIYQPNDSFGINANTILYAVWGHDCIACNSVGSFTSTGKCGVCSGSGNGSMRIKCTRCSGSGVVDTSVKCSSCDGLGGTYRLKCNKCGNYRTVSSRADLKCPYCSNGGVSVGVSGVGGGTRISTCSTCKGSGWKKGVDACSSCSGSGYRTVCSNCQGSGIATTKTICKSCGGKKYIRDTTEYGTVVFGDSNGDSKITTLDIVRMKKFFARFDSDEYFSEFNIYPGADANGDAFINSLDIVRLKRYFAEYDPATGKSSVKLGA